MRAFIAFLLAPIPSILLFILGNYLPLMLGGELPGAGTLRLQLIAIVAVGLVLSYAIIIFLALPIFIWLRRLKVERLSITLVVAALLGTLIAIGPEIYRVSSIGDASTFSYWSGECQTISNNARTACGYLDLGISAAFFAALGILAGATFWHVYKNPDRFKPLRVGAAYFSVVGLAVGLAAATADRSCHNLFRDGRKSIGPSATASFVVPQSDWSQFSQELRQFARDHDFSFRDHIRRQASVSTLYVSACSNAGVVIQVEEQRWRSQHSPDFDRDDVVRVGLYVTKDTAVWRAAWENLISILQARWTVEKVDSREQP